MVFNNIETPARLFQQVKAKGRQVIHKYLDIYRELYLEEFFISFGWMFLILDWINQEFSFLVGPLFLILFFLGVLLPLIIFSKELKSRSLLVRIPKIAFFCYLVLLFLVVFVFPAAVNRFSFISTPTVFLFAVTYSLTTEVLVGIDQNRILMNALQSQPNQFTSLRLNARKAITDGSYTKERVEQEVSERMKAEQLRTELITNISHDIRTPLTSILNFSELLSHENLNIEAQDYLGVVQKSAQRMLIMVEDLFTATKTAAGNLQLDVKTVDFSEGLMQTYAPLHTMFVVKGLELVYNRVNQTVPVWADGTHLSRVIQNLLINGAKYSVNDTRVYIKVKEEPERYRISFINISKEMLDISPDELMEQFVRGDTARHTEGSGLGLYIATNLLKAMSGELVLGIDGDVFTAAITLPKGKIENMGELN